MNAHIIILYLTTFIQRIFVQFIGARELDDVDFVTFVQFILTFVKYFRFFRKLDHIPVFPYRYK